MDSAVRSLQSQVATINNGLANLSNLATSSFEAIQKQMEVRIATVEGTVNQHTSEINSLKMQITRLQTLLGDIQSERPTPKPIDQSFNREIDPSILVPKLNFAKEYRRGQDPIFMTALGKMTELYVSVPTHYSAQHRLLTSICRQFVSFTGWILNQLCVSGEVLDLPEALFRRGVRDRAPVQVSLSYGRPASSDRRYSSIPSEVYLHPKYSEVLQNISEICDIDSLTPPLALDFVTRMMQEAAKIARNTMLRSSPDSLFSRRFLSIDVLERTVTLTNASEFAEITDHIHRQVIRGRLWAPFGRRVLLKGICADGGAVVRVPIGVLQLLGQHWGAVFGERRKSDLNAIDQYLEKH
ncbi:unnamed protein product, partial [Prorocentrum cordatum]